MDKSSANTMRAELQNKFMLEAGLPEADYSGVNPVSKFLLDISRGMDDKSREMMETELAGRERG